MRQMVVCFAELAMTSRARLGTCSNADNRFRMLPSQRWSVTLRSCDAVSTKSGIPYIEVPPRPVGYNFVCCLTHDIDFFRLVATMATARSRVHLRGTIGTFLDVLRGMRPVGEAIRNWLAVLTAPLVFIGLAPDPVESVSTTTPASTSREAPPSFVVPFKRPTRYRPRWPINPARGVPYGVDDIRETSHQHPCTRYRNCLARHRCLARRIRWRRGAASTHLSHWRARRPASGCTGSTSPTPRRERSKTPDSTTTRRGDTTTPSAYRAGTLQAFRLAGGQHTSRAAVVHHGYGAVLSRPHGSRSLPKRLRRCRGIVADACQLRRRARHQLARSEPGAGASVAPAL